MERTSPRVSRCGKSIGGNCICPTFWRGKSIEAAGSLHILLVAGKGEGAGTLENSEQDPMGLAKKSAKRKTDKELACFGKQGSADSDKPPARKHGVDPTA